MAASCTLREFDARFLKENLGIVYWWLCYWTAASCIHVLVWNIIYGADMCIQTRICLLFVCTGVGGKSRDIVR